MIFYKLIITNSSYMNDILYKYLIAPWIPLHRRPVLQKADRWLIAYQRVYYNTPYCLLMTDIVIHTMSPCVPRYCICRYLLPEDKLYYYREYLFEKIGI